MSFGSGVVVPELSDTEASALSCYLRSQRKGIFGDLDLHAGLLAHHPIMSDDEGADLVRMSEADSEMWDALQKLLRSLLKERKVGSRCPLCEWTDDPIPRWLSEWAEEVAAGNRRKPGTGRGRPRHNYARDARIVDVAIYLMHRRGFSKRAAVKLIAPHFPTVEASAISQALRRRLQK